MRFPLEVLCGLSFLLLSLRSAATHIVGGEIYYDHVIDHDYRVTIRLYRACSGISFDNAVTFGCYQGGEFLAAAGMDNAFIEELPLVASGPCMLLPSETCFEMATYSAVFTLPVFPEGCTISYLRCCRVPGMTNVVGSQGAGLAITCAMPPEGTITLGSPRFNSLPPLGTCFGQPFVFDLSATDLDGDSLAYEFSSPLLGGSSLDPLPGAGDLLAPPYPSITWAAGYSPDSAVDSDPAIALDPITGMLSLTPTMIGNYALSIKVKKYRNGTFFSETMRDFHIRVVACDPTVNAIIIPPSDPCAGLTVSFANGSVGATGYHWDLGELDLETDTSGTAEPEWTYSDPGIYEVSLIAYSGQECSDTTTTTINVTLPYQPMITAIGAVLSASGATSYQWYINGEPIDGANAQMFEATSTGSYTVETINANGCQGMSEPWVVELTGLEESGPRSMAIWPVPTSGSVFVSLAKPLFNGVAQISDLQGRIVHAQATGDRCILEFSLLDLPPGTYLLGLSDRYATYQARCIKIVD